MADKPLSPTHSPQGVIQSAGTVVSPMDAVRARMRAEAAANAVVPSRKPEPAGIAPSVIDRTLAVPAPAPSGLPMSTIGLIAFGGFAYAFRDEIGSVITAVADWIRAPSAPDPKPPRRRQK